MNTSPERLDALIDGYLMGDEDPDEQAELEKLLISDPEVARRFVASYADEAMLRLLMRGADQDMGFPGMAPLASAETRAMVSDGAPARNGRRQTRPRRGSGRSSSPAKRFALPAIAAGLLFMAGTWLLMSQPRPMEAPIAEITGLSGSPCSLVSKGRKTRGAPGTRVVSGDSIKTAADTTVKLQWYATSLPESRQPNREDSHLQLSANTIVDLHTSPRGEKRVLLKQGQINCEVAPQPSGRPMILITPHAETQVVGTRFTLRVSATQTHLAVESGRVLFTRKKDQQSVTVNTGQQIDDKTLLLNAVDTPQEPVAPPKTEPSKQEPMPLRFTAWKSLFSGTNLDGWEAMKGSWSVQTGMIVGKSQADDPLRGAALDSMGQYKDFEMKARLRISGARYGEIQTRNSGSVFSIEVPEQGAWREIRILIHGDHVEATLDGKPWTVSVDDSNGRTDAGPIGLYVTEGGVIEVERIQIREVIPQP